MRRQNQFIWFTDVVVYGMFISIYDTMMESVFDWVRWHCSAEMSVTVHWLLAIVHSQQ